MSIVREIPSLQTTILKSIAKQPNLYITEKSFRRSQYLIPVHMRHDILQTLVDYLIEAGRMTDDVIPISFYQCDRLSLSLQNSKVSGKYIEKLVHQCQNFTNLNLSGCFQVTDVIVERILSTCSQLHSLDVRNCRKLTDDSLKFIVEKGIRLTSINIGGNFNISLDGIRFFVSNHPNITAFREIHISGLPVSDDILGIISSRCKNVECFSLAFSNTSEESLRRLLTNIGQTIKSLSIAWVNASGLAEGDLDTSFLDFLARCCPRLQVLDISGNKNISISSIQQLLDFKLCQSEADPETWKPIMNLKAKFMGGSKLQIEQLSASHPYARIES